MRELRTAVIGIGNMGTAHARCIREGEIPGLELAAVCDLRPERLRWAEENWPGVARTADWRSLLDPALPLDAVIIAVPHPLHCEMAQAFLEAGKHVLSEKPLDIRLSRARKAVAAAEERGLVFAVMFNQRTDPLFIRAREIVRREFAFEGLRDTLTLVRMEGISHLAAEPESAFFPLREDRPAAERAVRLWCEELGAEGLGLMFLERGEEPRLTPLVYIPGSGTVFWENSCASGTSAAGMALAKESGADVDLTLREPGGVLRVESDPRRGETWLYGQTRLLGEYDE